MGIEDFSSWLLTSLASIALERYVQRIIDDAMDESNRLSPEKRAELHEAFYNDPEHPLNWRNLLELGFNC